MTDLSKLVDSCSSTTKNTISPLPQCLWPPHIESCRLIMTGFYPYHHEANVMPCDKLKKVYISTFIRLMVSNLAECWLREGGSERKPSSHRRFFAFLFLLCLRKFRLFLCVFFAYESPDHWYRKCFVKSVILGIKIVKWRNILFILVYTT